jgi:hypothetical protein
MPVEPIFIICNCAEERDCETTGSANFFKSCTPVLMLPHNAMIFFMHAHTVFDCLNLSMEVCEVCIKVLDVPKTITPPFQRVTILAQAIFSYVKCILPIMGIFGVTIWYNHFHKAEAMCYRASTMNTIIVSYSVDDQSFSWCEANSKVPLLPFHCIAIYLEAGSFRLGD